MEYIIYKPDLPVVDPTSPQYMKCLMEYYGDHLVTPRSSYEGFLKELREYFSLRQKRFNEIDPVTYATFDSDSFDESVSTLFFVPKTTRSERFYQDYHRAFYDQSVVCILYNRRTDRFSSNDSFLELFLTVYRGIDQSEVYAVTPVYKDYLNTLYMYNEVLYNECK